MCGIEYPDILVTIYLYAGNFIEIRSIDEYFTMV